MRFRCAQMRPRSMLVDPNACPKCSDALSLDACRSKRVSGMLTWALARRSSIQIGFRCAQMRSRSTLVTPMRFRFAEMSSRSTLVHSNAFPMWSDALSPDVCPSKCVSYVVRCAGAQKVHLAQTGMCQTDLWPLAKYLSLWSSSSQRQTLPESEFERPSTTSI